jgi:hypothetical protein
MTLLPRYCDEPASTTIAPAEAAEELPVEISMEPEDEDAPPVLTLKAPLKPDASPVSRPIRPLLPRTAAGV